MNKAVVAIRTLLALGVLAAVPLNLGAQEKAAPLLVVISVDGLRPDYVTAADAHGSKVPNLRRFLKQGTYAEGVVGVVPTVTYPSHTTLMTGVWPAKHGIYANTMFDPLQKNFQGWYWYAEDIRVPTLWDAAAQAGRTTASIQWPVTVGAKITWDIPEVWRAGTPEDVKLLHALSTPGLLSEAARQIGEYRGGIDTSGDGDEVRGKYAVWILENKRPGLLVLHLTALDHTEHETGVFSAESVAILERLDAVIGKVWEVAEKIAPGRTYFAVVSDHGFASYDQQLNLFPAFREAKLFTADDKGNITDWMAMPWVTGGSAAIVLKDPKDLTTLGEVRELLTETTGRPDKRNRSRARRGRVATAWRISDRDIFRWPEAGLAHRISLTGPVISKVKPGGTHGELPDVPELHAAFFFAGPGVPAGKNLGLIDMRDIAPTLAKEAGLSLPGAEGKPLLP